MKGGPYPPGLFVGMQLTRLADSRASAQIEQVVNGFKSRYRSHRDLKNFSINYPNYLSSILFGLIRYWNFL